MTMKVLLRKYKEDGDIEFAPVYFNSTTKAVINSNKYNLVKSFQEILSIIDNWINKRPGWVIDSVDAECINF